jgi:ATP-binding cassette subfamily B protein
VSFTYPEANVPSLHGVHLKIRRGDWIGIHGESGSGKSTFLQMLYGFYHPKQGNLKWNGHAYASFDVTSIRANFGVVEQFPFLFHGSIRDNISMFGRFSFSEPELKQRFAGFALIESLLSMLDFEISERGENISMGQKQMITFLRAYLAKPEVWILDEATAFFDREAESEVLRALTALKGEGVTVVQVAHRPEALSQMKRMMRVANGRMSETDYGILSP